jgi:SAM-dependent methyltransferase
LHREGTIFRDPLPREYRQAVLELAGFCQFYKNHLGRREMHHPGERRAIAEEAFPAMQRGWMELSTRAALAAAEFLDDTETLREARLVSEHLVTPYLVEAPVLRRAYEKPLGYPGDYVVMEHYFANTFEGESAFGMVFNKITNEHPLSAGVRTRSQRVSEAIIQRARSANGAGALRVLSLGSGIGAEVALVHNSVSHPVKWTLIDQEDQALAVAYRNARKLSQDSDRLPDVTCVNVSFSQLFRGEIAPETWGEQDVVFALGLFDYLRDAGATLLVQALYSLLRPGGTLFIGNAANPNTHFWEPELALRWSLLYRDVGQMEALGAALPTSAGTELGLEPAGAYHILECQKP